MNTLRIPFTIFCLLALSALSTYAAQLASAKVLQVEGTVTKYSADGKSGALKVGDILTQGDSISATALSSANLVFSNGSTVTVEENTSVSIAKLSQAPFGGGQSYEQLQADPSQSQTLLELNYGELQFHVKKLASNSSFDIETPLGTAAVRGTQGSVKLFYNAERQEFLLVVNNIDGIIDIISRYIGDFDFGGGSIGDKGYDSSLSDDKAEPIPPQNTVIIRLHRSDPLFDTLFKIYQNFIPTEPTPGNLELPVPDLTPEDPGVIITPEDPGVIIVSPEDDA